ncbi:MAG: hypothetical protein ACM3QZ_08495 [Solirubrobacterales bacterium]
MPNSSDIMPWTVRVIVRDSKKFDLAKLAETMQNSMASIAKIRVENIRFKKYGLLLKGTGPFQDIMRIGEAVYQDTSDGSLEFVVHIGEREAFLIKEGGIFDLNVSNYNGPQVPVFDDEDAEDPDIDRMGFGV